MGPETFCDRASAQIGSNGSGVFPKSGFKCGLLSVLFCTWISPGFGPRLLDPVLTSCNLTLVLSMALIYYSRFWFSLL